MACVSSNEFKGFCNCFFIMRLFCKVFQYLDTKIQEVIIFLRFLIFSILSFKELRTGLTSYYTSYKTENFIDLRNETLKEKLAV